MICCILCSVRQERQAVQSGSKGLILNFTPLNEERGQGGPVRGKMEPFWDVIFLKNTYSKSTFRLLGAELLWAP